MTDLTVLQPDYWRQRAKEAREAAREVHPGNRRILEDVAQSYEEMADLMEKHERPAKPALLPGPAAKRIPDGRHQRPVPPARTCCSTQR